MTTVNIETLRARVQALGHKLLTGTFQIDGEERQGLYILNPKTDELALVVGNRSGDLIDIEDWCAVRETNAGAPSDATADDFRGPKVSSDYERFLQLIVIVSPKDRSRAMDIRSSIEPRAAAGHVAHRRW
jgi:hypothetical protein